MKILFEHDHLYYLPQFEPVIQKLKLMGKHDLFGSLNVSVPKIERNLFSFEMERLGIENVPGNFEPQRRRILKEMNFDLIFVGNKSSLSAIKTNNSFSVMIYHGIGLKQSYYSDLTKDMDLICVESEERKAILEEKGYPAVITGFTKLDFIGAYKKPENDRPKVLFAPTHFPSSLQKTIPFLNLINGLDLKIKLHHFYWTNPTYIKIRLQLELAIQSQSNIEIVQFEHYNILPLYAECDLLISDISSTLFEFLPFNRPIIQTTYSTLRLKYKLFPGQLKKRMDQDRVSQIDFTTHCDSPEQLSGIIQESLNKPTIKSGEREIAKNKFLGRCDGNASERVINALESAGIPIGERD
jgi:CDP-glycerol glycerophosphotransferase (TagB/SpsB family)